MFDTVMVSTDSKEYALIAKEFGALMEKKASAVAYYHIKGAIYIVNVKEFEKDIFFYKKGAYAYMMKNEDSIDIDTDS